MILAGIILYKLGVVSGITSIGDIFKSIEIIVKAMIKKSLTQN